MANSNGYYVIITEMKRGRPADGGAPFSILGSHPCKCDRDSMTVRTQLGFDFVKNQMLLLCAVIVRAGEDIESKKIHWGGPDNSKHHAYVVGPFEPTVYTAVKQHIAQSGFPEHFEVVQFDKNLFG